MATPFIGEITLFGFNFAPRNYAFCSGQLLPIQQNTALFSILGTTYGGNGQTNFALPDLRSRTPIHAGQGPGLSSFVLGQVSGVENVTLVSTQMPSHQHTASASSGAPVVASPADAAWASGGNAAYDASANTAMSTNALAIAGANQAHNNQQPSLALNYCIALFGIFPSRN